MRQKRDPRVAASAATLAPMLVLERLVLVADAASPDRPVRGLGEARAGALRLRSSYWLQVAGLGMLRIRIVSREAPRRGRVVYHFAVTSRMRARPH